MKQSSNPKRSRGRGNMGGRGNARRSNAPRNHTLESNGPEGRVRGSVSQIHEKYLALARDASSAGDHISAENYYQHAEHYFRVKNGNGGGGPPRSGGPNKGNGAGGGRNTSFEGGSSHSGNASKSNDRSGNPPLEAGAAGAEPESSDNEPPAA